MPTTVEKVREHLGLSPARPVDDAALSSAVGAANDYVCAMRPDLTLDPETGEVLEAWALRAEQAATLYAARLYGRRGSVQGVAAFQEAGVMVLPNDPDVRALLELGAWQRSVIA